MPIISTIGRKSLKVRALIGLIYGLLTLGALSMVYPFLLMLAGSTKTAVDVSDTRVIPEFLVSDTALYRKYMEGLFNESLVSMKAVYDLDVSSFMAIDPPSAPNAALVDTWREFIEAADLPAYTYAVGLVAVQTTRSVVPFQLRKLKDQLILKYNNDVVLMNRDLGMNSTSWNVFFVLAEEYLLRRYMPGKEPFDLEFNRFKATVPEKHRYYFSPEGFFKRGYLDPQYTRRLEAYNDTHGTSYASWDDVRLDRTLPAGPGRTDVERKDWTEFVRTLLNLLWVRVEPSATPAYRDFLRAKYAGDVEALNRNYGAAYASFDDIPICDAPPEAGVPLSDWDAFIQGWKDPDTGVFHMAPVESLRVHSLDFLFRDYLAARFETVERANAALGTSFRNWMDAFPPQRDAHYLSFQADAGWLRREFVTRNYRTVIDYICLHGRAILNTVIYCSLAVLCALIVNPLAAYGLSRYKPPSAYKVLLFLMLTMAFPPMVTQIPVFLMLRQFNLLNTFLALLLPGLANGYSIFLLKGFFDSLPQELYESASLDGAGEMRMFWQITMNLSKPILAVIALSAFTHSYSNFMMALLICQDEKMWTLMPWLYQLQQRSAPGVIYASLIIAAIPTFITFAFCQNIIMRGIVVPVEK